MKKNIVFVRFVISVSLFLTGIPNVQAQQQNNSDAAIRQEIRGQAMQTIQKGYEVYATCSSADYMEQFVNLFKNKEAKVYNDLLGLKKGRELTAEKYAQILGGSGVKNVIVNISGISILDEPYKENGKWKVDVAFNKRMSYYTACGVYFNSNDFYHADYNLEASMVYDEVDKKCLIVGITGGVDSYDELPEQYFVLKLTDELDRKLTYRQRPIKFNSGDQALIAGEFNPAAFSHESPKISRQLQPIFDEDCLLATMAYGSRKSTVIQNSTSFLLRPHVDLGLGGLSIDEGKSNVDVSSSSFGFGVDFGMLLMNVEKLTLNAFAGIGLNMSTIDLDYSNSGLISIGAKDIDDDTYTRVYKGVDISQKVKLTELAVPVYLDAEYDMSSGLVAYGDLGVRLNFNMSKSTDAGSAMVSEVYGIYSQYGNQVLDGYWDSNLFGKDKDLKANVNDPDGVSSMTFDVIGGAGLRYYIPNTPIGIDMGLRFQLGMSEIIKPDDNAGTGNVIGSYNNETEQIANLADMLTSVKRNVLALNIGLIFKF